MKKLGNRVRINKGMDALFEGASPEAVNNALQIIRKQGEVFKKAFAASKLGAMLGLYKLIDETMARTNRENSCKRGCNFCCHINVDITDPEAALIHHHCKQHNIRVEAKYLHARLHVPKLELPFNKVSACVFLKNGECSIYEVRPLKCRTYLVVNEPALCDAVTYPAPHHGTWVVNDLDVQMELSAYVNALKGKSADRMERMLLNYYK